MRIRSSLRFKVALAFSALAILLLVAQAFGVKVLVEAQVERFITALIADDMAGILRSYRLDPTLVPPFDARLSGHVSEAGQARVTLPTDAATLSKGIHEIIVDGREIHVAVATLGKERIYRVYDFSAYEERFRDMSAVLMAVAGIFALLTIWLAYGLSGLLLRQVTGFVRQVKALRLGTTTEINPGRYDEAELIDLVSAFNEYHLRMALMVEREKEFVANLSHELRTPLTSIRTSCELLEQDPTIGSKSLARLRQIDRAAHRMSELSNALLMLARESSSAETGPVRLARSIQEALDPFAEPLAAKEVRTLIDVDWRLWVIANRAALTIVLSNLIDNAARHTERGQLRFSYEDGRLRIADTGEGIPDDAMPLVFDRFYQADPEQSADKGLGIGLAIVKKICDRYGWPIGMDSVPGEGTTVSLGLPPSTRAGDFTKN